MYDYSTSLSSTTTMGTLANTQTPFYSREALQSIDHDAVSHYNIPSIVLMENAARNATEFILNSIEDDLRENIVVLCGGGNNGGDGYAIARHLTNANCNVQILQLNDPTSRDAKTKCIYLLGLWEFQRSHGTKKFVAMR